MAQRSDPLKTQHGKLRRQLSPNAPRKLTSVTGFLPGQADSPTSKQWLFAHYYVYGDSLDQAYIKAYNDTDRPYNWRRAKIGKLLASPRVQKVIQSIRNDMLVHEHMTPELHLAALRMIRDGAMEAGQFSAAQAAERSRGEAMGYYVTRIVTPPSERGMNEVLDAIRTILTKHPDLGEQIGLPVIEGSFNVVADQAEEQPVEVESSPEANERNVEDSTQG